MLIQAQMTVSAANRPMRATSFVFNTFIGTYLQFSPTIASSAVGVNAAGGRLKNSLQRVGAIRTGIKSGKTVKKTGNSWYRFDIPREM